jgi:hypothetical protein
MKYLTSHYLKIPIGIRQSREQHGPKVKVTAPPKKNPEVRNSQGFSFEVRKIPLRFKHH